MRTHTFGVLGLVLLGAGILGILVGAAVVTSWVLQPTASPQATAPQPTVPVVPAIPKPPDAGQFASNGQRIYLTGVGGSGPIPYSGGMMGRPGMTGGSLGCANCHGSAGTGSQVRMIRKAPDIRYSTLTAPTSVGGTTRPGWTDAQIAEAIRTGKDPDGTPLHSVMPRYDMDDSDMADLIGYLKELSPK